MLADWIHIVWLGACFIGLFAFAEWLYHGLRVDVELSRKVVHFGTGILTLLFPAFLTSHWSVLLLCASFACILVWSLKYNKLQSINAIERQSWGSLLYPLAVYLTFLFFLVFKLEGQYVSYLFYYLPILTLAICDPMAALVGKKFPLGRFKINNGYKSLMGCFAFFISSFVLTMALFVHFAHMPFTGIVFTYYATIAICATIAEALSPKGIDNLTIPFAVMLILFLTQWY